MALYIDSAYIPEISEVAYTVPVAGITTNPTILLAARDRGQTLSSLQLLRELLQKFVGSIFMQPGEVDAEEMLQQARAYRLQFPHQSGDQAADDRVKDALSYLDKK